MPRRPVTAARPRVLQNVQPFTVDSASFLAAVYATTRGCPLRRRLRIGLSVAVIGLVLPTAACDSGSSPATTPSLADRGTVLTTAKPTRQDLSNRVTLTGTVTIDPVFGLVAPVKGQIRYATVPEPTKTPKKPTLVATVWAKGKGRAVKVPAGAVFTGRLVDDQATVPAGMPVASAKHVGYGIVAEIGGAQAYQISGALSTVRAQITKGPGPFGCRVLGTIAALPAGTIPEPPAPDPQPSESPRPGGKPGPIILEPDPEPGNRPEPSEATGMRVVCVPPAKVKLINGAEVTLEVITARASDALVLPVEAVAGSQGKGVVDVVGPDGTRESREVVLGLTDGKVIQVRSGLSESDTVAVPGPDLPKPPPGRDDEGAVTK